MTTPVEYFNAGGANSGGLGIIRQSPRHMLSQGSDENNNYGPWNYRWANSDNFIAKSSYNIANDAFQVVQTFDFDLIPSGGQNPLTETRSNLNIDGTPNYKPINGFVNTFATLIPIARGSSSLKSIMPNGLGYLRKINASQFSSFFKGNLARFTPKKRGFINRILNKGVDMYNNQISNGLITLKTLAIKKLIREEE